MRAYDTASVWAMSIHTVGFYENPSTNHHPVRACEAGSFWAMSNLYDLTKTLLQTMILYDLTKTHLLATILSELTKRAHSGQ